MPWQLLIWLLAFILQSGLLGINLWKLVQLTDLEADFLNPHDASKSYNKLVVPELATQATGAALLVLSGNWLIGFVQVAMTAYCFYQLQHGGLSVEATEIIRELTPRRKALIYKSGFHLFAFIWTVYRFIGVIVASLLTPAGRSAARSILREAASTLHRRKRRRSA